MVKIVLFLSLSQYAISAGITSHSKRDAPSVAMMSLLFSPTDEEKDANRPVFAVSSKGY